MAKSTKVNMLQDEKQPSKKPTLPSSIPVNPKRSDKKLETKKARQEANVKQQLIQRGLENEKLADAN
jgi:hypothetical protein